MYLLGDVVPVNYSGGRVRIMSVIGHTVRDGQDVLILTSGPGNVAIGYVIDGEVRLRCETNINKDINYIENMLSMIDIDKGTPLYNRTLLHVVGEEDVLE
jgi:hypothetical protein